AGGRIGQGAADVHARVFVHQAALAGGGVDREQSVGVAIARVAHVQGGAVLAQAGIARGQAVLEGDAVVLRPGVAFAPQQVDAAILARAGGEAQAVVGGGDVFADPVGVAFDQAAFAAGQVDPVQVVPRRVTVGHADQEGVGAAGAEADHARGRLR